MSIEEIKKIKNEEWEDLKEIDLEIVEIDPNGKDINTFGEWKRRISEFRKMYDDIIGYPDDEAEPEMIQRFILEKLEIIIRNSNISDSTSLKMKRYKRFETIIDVHRLTMLARDDFFY